MNIRTFQPGDDATQAALFNVSAFALPGFKPAHVDEVRRRTRVRGFDPTARFYAEEGGQVVGYCALDPQQGRVGFPWCKKGFEAARPRLFEAALKSARERGLARLFSAYRKDWAPVLQFLTDHGFRHARDVVNFAMPAAELPTVAARGGGSATQPLTRDDLPAVAEMGRGLVRLPDAELEKYFFQNMYFPAEAVFVVRDRNGEPAGVGIGVEGANYADATKTDPLAPCFRLGAFGTEGLNTKRVNGLFSFLVRKPEQTLTVGLACLAEAAADMTDGTVGTLAAQCPSDVPHLIHFYPRYFQEQGRFPVYELPLGGQSNPRQHTAGPDGQGSAVGTQEPGD